MSLTRAIPKFLSAQFHQLRGPGFKRVQRASSYVGTLKLRKTARFCSTQREALSNEQAQQENWRCRQDLATAYRGLEWYNLHEGVSTHLTLMAPARDGNGKVMLAIRHGDHWSEVTPSSLIALNEKGEVVEGEGGVQLEALMVHKGVHDARPDAVCVFHLHMPFSTALGMLEEDCFKMYHQTHCRFYKSFAYDDQYQGSADSLDEGKRLAKSMQHNRLLFMVNHGVCIAGPNVAAAFNDAYYLERLSQLQVFAMATGKKLREIPDDVAKLTYEQTMENFQHYADLHFEAVRRKLLAIDPNFLSS